MPGQREGHVRVVERVAEEVVEEMMRELRPLRDRLNAEEVALLHAVLSMAFLEGVQTGVARLDRALSESFKRLHPEPPL